MAQEHVLRALEIAKEIGDRDGVASAYGNLGTVCQSTGDYAKAEEYNKMALSISTEIEDGEKEFQCLFHLA